MQNSVVYITRVYNLEFSHHTIFLTSDLNSNIGIHLREQFSLVADKKVCMAFFFPVNEILQDRLFKIINIDLLLYFFKKSKYFKFYC